MLGVLVVVAAFAAVAYVVYRHSPGSRDPVTPPVDLRLLPGGKMELKNAPLQDITISLRDPDGYWIPYGITTPDTTPWVVQVPDTAFRQKYPALREARMMVESRTPGGQLLGRTTGLTYTVPA